MSDDDDTLPPLLPGEVPCVDCGKAPGQPCADLDGLDGDAPELERLAFAKLLSWRSNRDLFTNRRFHLFRLHTRPGNRPWEHLFAIGGL